MANKVSVEINANVQGFVDGMDKASQSTQKYETDMRKVSDYTVSFNKKLRESKQDVRNLALSYAMLDKEAKNSDFGRRMKQQLEEAKKEAAQLIDMQKDIQRELKSMASDTRAIDMVADSVGLIGHAASAASGAIAVMTGNDKKAREALVMFTTAQSTLNVVKQIGNELQKESNTLLAINAIRNAAAAKAIKLQESNTIAATVAQKAFNVVANANPYVLLATAVLALVAAVGAYIAITSNAETETQRLAKTMHDASMQGQKDAADEVVKLDLLYKATQDTSLAIEDREKAVKKLQDQYPAYFANMSKEQIMLGQAETAYYKLRDAIIATAKARAYEQKITEIEKENIDLRSKKQELEKKQASKDKRKQNVNEVANTVGFVNPLVAIGIRAGAAWQENKEDKELLEINQKLTDNKKQQEELAGEALKHKKEELSLEKQNPASGGGGGGGGKTTPKPQPEPPTYKEGSISEMTKRISELKRQLEDGLIPEDKVQDTLNEITSLEDKIQKIRIKFGWEVDPSIEEARKAKEKIQAALEAADADYANIKMEPGQSSFEKAIGAELYEKGIEGIEKQMDWNDKLIEQLSIVRDAYLAIGEAGAEGAEGIAIQIGMLLEKQQELTEEAQKQQAIIKKNEKIVDQYETLSDVAASTANSFASLASILGGDQEDPAAKVAGIMAQAVANMFAGMAKASEQAWSLGPWGWAAFSAAATAQTLAMVAQIKSAAKFAEGGVVGGSSYVGDRLLARVNSGEAILNQRQQNRALELMDNATTPSNIGAIHVEGKIRGTDILLVGKNTNKMLAKSGNTINIE